MEPGAARTESLGNVDGDDLSQRIQIKISRPHHKVADPSLNEMYHDEEDEKAEVEEVEETAGSPTKRTSDHLRADTVYFDTENHKTYILSPQTLPMPESPDEHDDDEHDGGHHGLTMNDSLTPSTKMTLSVASSENEGSPSPEYNALTTKSSPSPVTMKGPVLQIIPSDSHLIRTKTASVTPNGYGMECVEEAFAVSIEAEPVGTVSDRVHVVNEQYDISTTRDSSSHFRRIGDSEQERLTIAPNDSTSEDSKYYSYGTMEDEKEENEEVIFFDDDTDDEPTVFRMDGIEEEMDPDLDDDIADSEFESDEVMVLRKTSLAKSATAATVATVVRSDSVRSPSTPRHERNFQQLSELQGIF